MFVPTLYFLQPEVAGGLGQKTVIENRQALESGMARIPKIKYLEYVFDGWLGDSLLTSFPVYIVSKYLANNMITSKLSGVAFEYVEVSKSELFIELYPDLLLPPFTWMQPKGNVISVNNKIKKWSGHDICLNQDGDLFVTEIAMEVLRKHSLEHCDTKKIDND